MSKKRKERPQATTLHSFFGAESETGVIQQNQKKRRASLDSRTLLISEDVIIIESDEDDVPIKSEIKETRTEHRLEQEATTSGGFIRSNVNEQCKLRSSCSNSHELMSQHVENVCTQVSVSSPQSKTAPFIKKPSCPSQSSTTQETRRPDAAGSKEQCRPSGVSMADSPIGIDALSSTASLVEDQRFEVLNTQMKRNLKVDDEPDFTLQDGLEADDVYDILLDLKEEDHEPDPINTSNEGDCPLCGASFLHMSLLEIQEHANACIDALKSPDILLDPDPSSSSLRTYPSLPSSSGSGIKYRTSASSNAFSVLMSGYDEKNAWEEAQENESKNIKTKKANGNRRKAPFYKVMQGMPIAVDAFRYGSIPGVTAYFLTHAHSDHYTNLTNNWRNGPIYCSETTANLIMHMLSVEKKWVHTLPMNTQTIVPNTGGVRVTLIEANHCPGSCLFLFEGPQTVNAGDSIVKSPFIGSSRTFRYLHCGDFRACPQHVLHPALKGKRIDTVYLDTTYLDPKYCFPPQPMVISACAELAKRIIRKKSILGEGILEDEQTMTNTSLQSWVKAEDLVKPKGKQKEKANDNILALVGTYTIGKERIVKAIAHALNTKVYCDSRKAAVLRCEADSELHALLTNDPFEAGVHVVPLGQVTSDRIQEYLDRWKGHWTRAVAFRPTGWTYSPPVGTDMSPSISSVISRSQSRTFTHAHLRPARNSTPKFMQYGIPYSEHSSFSELTCFALSLDWTRIIATVNVGSAASRNKIQNWVEKWKVEKKKRRDVDGCTFVKPRNMEYW